MTYSKSLIRVVILDDHPIVRRAFEIILASDEGIRLVGSFGHSADLIKWLNKESCDILILDYVLRDDEIDGLSLIKKLLIRYADLKILLVSSMESSAVIRSAFTFGIRGYISKREEKDIFIDAVRTVASNRIYLSDRKGIELPEYIIEDKHALTSSFPERKKKLIPDERLTPRELEVIHYFLTGMSVIDIAVKLKRSCKTISGHKQSALRKLGLNSDLELFRYHEELLR